MEFSRDYLSQVELLLQILPIINDQECFAVKGGTAINLFVRNMPRLSVDIDLTYLPIEPRDKFLQNITSALNKLSNDIETKGTNNYRIEKKHTNSTKQLSKLFVYSGDTNIKIEPNFILRGSVFDCETMPLCQNAQDEFLLFTDASTLSFADLYGGKICAALARQHPRDLFDVKLLLENEGITEPLRQAFVIYLASNSRPIHELLNPKPNLVNFEKAFENEFSGMTQLPVTFDELIETRFSLIKHLLQSLSDNERKFLISLKAGEPDWSAMSIPGIDKLPGLAWKIMNIRKMDKKKQNEQYENLKRVLEL